MAKSQATGTVRLSRILRAPPERVYKAFLDPQALVKWMAPHGFTATVHKLEAKVGGRYEMSFTNLGTGKSHKFGGTYLELKPAKRIKNTDSFADPKMPGEMTATFTFEKVATGTRLDILQEGLPAAIPVEFAIMGWQESLELLKLLVEPEIPDAPA
jgi:uncharacterized protein YndB with AHSA1/START domain